MSKQIVTFYRTTADGPVEIGQIMFDGKAITTSGEAQSRLDTVFEGVDTNDPAAVERAMRDAPRIFDGAYIRASVEAG